MLHRLRRILFHTAAAASALLLVAALTLWLLSYFRYDCIDHGTTVGLGLAIRSSAGRVEVIRSIFLSMPDGLSHETGPRPFLDQSRDWSYADTSDVIWGFPRLKLLGCEYAASPPGSAVYPAHWLYVPYSYVAILLSIMPTLWLLTRNRRRRNNRLAHGLCPNCAYDLRAHHPGDKCPECGTPIVQNAAPAGCPPFNG